MKRKKAKGATPPAVTPDDTVRPPTPEQIARRAYERYEGRGRVPGSELEDWLAAERELRARGRSPKA